MKMIPENKWLTLAHRLINFRLVTQAILLIATFVFLRTMLVQGLYRLFTDGSVELPQWWPTAIQVFPNDLLIPYEEWTMLGAALLQPKFALAFASFTGVSFLFCRRIRWSTYGLMTRIVVCVAAAIMAWAYSFYGYNLYVDQSHLLDRILVLSLCIATFLHPAFVAPFICVTLLSMSQFEYPLGGYSLTDKQMPLHAIILFAAFHLNTVGKHSLSRLSDSVRGWRRRSGRAGSKLISYALSRPRWLLVGFNGRVFVFVLLCMIGSAYLVPALHKIEISPSGTEWLLQSNLDRHIAGSVLRNNHFFFSEGGGETALLLGQKFGWILVISTLMIEFSALLLLVNRRFASVILLLLGFLHVGICTLSGIFFWKWIILDLLLAGLVLTREARPVFTKQALALSIVLMLTATMHFSPIALGWFDTGLISNYRITVTTEEGDELVLPGSSMTPYGLFFTFERFDFLNPERRMKGMNTTEDFVAAHEINQSKTVDIASRLQEADKSVIDEDGSKLFDTFIKRYFSNWNRTLDRNLFPLDLFRAPPHILSGNSEGSFQWDSRVTRVDVYYETSHYDGEEVIPIGVHLIRRIDILPQER